MNEFSSKLFKSNIETDLIKLWQHSQNPALELSCISNTLKSLLFSFLNSSQQAEIQLLIEDVEFLEELIKFDSVQGGIEPQKPNVDHSLDSTLVTEQSHSKYEEGEGENLSKTILLESFSHLIKNECISTTQNNQNSKKNTQTNQKKKILQNSIQEKIEIEEIELLPFPALNSGVFKHV